MKDEILSQIRPFVFQDVATKVSGMLDQYRSQIEENHMPHDVSGDAVQLLQDQIDHLTRALVMVTKVPKSTEGAMMARGIAEEAISTIPAADG
jgi:hypothetical protein